MLALGFGKTRVDSFDLQCLKLDSRATRPWFENNYQHDFMLAKRFRYHPAYTTMMVRARLKNAQYRELAGMTWPRPLTPAALLGLLGLYAKYLAATLGACNED